MKTRRRDVLLGATAAVAVGRELAGAGDRARHQRAQAGDRLAERLARRGTSAERLAQSITAMSDGRLKVTVYPAGSLVRALEVFDAVSAGVADMYLTDEAYFQDKSPALNFFAAVPYGMTADELCSWIDFGGGQALWDEVDAQFNVKPLMGSNTGVQMGGWFTKEINSPEDYKGLRYRMTGARCRGPAPHGGHGRDDSLSARSSARSNPARSTPPSGSDPGRTWISVSIKRPIIITTPASTSPART